MANKDDIPTVIAIVGPTASGKTALSLEIAQQLSTEIIACDCRTVYRHFNIGTAKPSPAEQARVKHHLIDVVEPDEDFTVAQFVESSKAIIENLHRQGKPTIVCGGTGFYSRALLEGLEIPKVAPQPELRAQLRAYAQAEGNQVLHDRLRALDPVSADRLAVNDVFRVVRAIEVSTVCGVPFSMVSKRVSPPFRTIWIGLNAADRNHLYAIIRQRFDVQLQDGLVEEVLALHKRYGMNQKIMHTVNYKQIARYAENILTLEQALEEALRHNNQLARKQLIWFRSNTKINWFEIDKATKTELHQAIQAFLAQQM